MRPRRHASPSRARVTRHDSAVWVVVAGKHARLRRGAVRRLRVRCAGTIVCPDAVLLPVHERQPVHWGLQQLQQRPLRLPQRLPDAVPDAREYLPVHRSGHTCTQKSPVALFTVWHATERGTRDGSEQLRGHGRGSVSEPRDAARGNSNINAPTLNAACPGIDPKKQKCCSQSFSHGYGAICPLAQSCCNGFSIKT